VALEDGIEGNLLVHTVAAAGCLTLAAGWLGSGRRKYVWVPLRPPLAWNQEKINGSADSHLLLSTEQVAALARDLHAALMQLDQRHAIEEFFAPDPIPADERRAVLEQYTRLLASHGWTVNVDESQTRRTLERTSVSEEMDKWPQTDREELARLEALVAQVLKGVRSSSRVLYQNK
jgi:hypothetical protein